MTNKIVSGSFIVIEDHSRRGTFLNGEKIGRGNTRVLHSACTISLGVSRIAFSFDLIRADFTWKEPTPITLEDGQILHLTNELIGQGSQYDVHLVVSPDSYNNQHVCRTPRRVLHQGEERAKYFARLKNEVTLLKNLSHRNITRVVHHFAKPDGAVSMIHPIVCGGNLAAYMKISQLNENQAHFIFCQLLSAFKYLHENHVIHLDVKPMNILTSSMRYPFPQVTVCDFGIAVCTKNQDIQPLSRGTYSYMAPELLPAEKHLSTKVDCWSLGIILHQMVTGLLPYQVHLNNERLKPDHTWQRQRHWILNVGVDITQHSIWTTKSSEVKSLIQGLLNKNYKERFDCQKALRSSFIHRGYLKYQEAFDKFRFEEPSKRLQNSSNSPIYNPGPYPCNDVPANAGRVFKKIKYANPVLV
ncbi:kinase-like protein [Hesseltinella vesiculosa]|uniref:non-specific serine/threonine protein kinase n=1 Tax=Hesseltinella vesiculosa TaxID=101127 RepID=A0A1X2G3B1_9FUNG|nr:kinase-like protein [Hesseltinella vesiculosa]